jgi:hypothetical protein
MIFDDSASPALILYRRGDFAIDPAAVHWLNNPIRIDLTNAPPWLSDTGGPVLVGCAGSHDRI